MQKQVEDIGQCLLVLDGVGHIHPGLGDIVSDMVDADTLDNGGAGAGLQLAAAEVIVQGGARRIGQADNDVGVALFQRRGYPCQGTASANGTDKTIHPPVGLLPDFCSRGAAVDIHIGEVVELARPDGAVLFLSGEFFRQPLGSVYIVVGVAVRGGAHQVQVSAQQFQRVNLFLALGNGHDHRTAVSQGVGEQGQPDAGIARGALDDAPSRPQFTARLGGAYNAQGSAVLHRAAGVEKLGLAENGATGQLGDLLEVQQGSIADQLGDVRGRVHDVFSGKARARVCHSAIGWSGSGAQVEFVSPQPQQQ